MSLLFQPDAEQQHLLELLFVNHPQHCSLGLTLLEQRADKSFFLRPLALLVRTTTIEEERQRITAFLNRHLSTEWAAVRSELDVLDDAIDEEGNPLDRQALLQQANGYEQHAAAYDYCWALHPPLAYLYQYHVADLQEYQLIEQAKWGLKRLQQWFPQEPEYFFDYARLLEETPERTAEQEAYLVRAATVPNTTPDYLNRLALYYDQVQGDRTKMLHWLHRSLALNEQHAHTHYLLAEWYHIAAQWEHAQTHYQQSATLHTDDGNYSRGYALFLLQRQQFDQALYWANKAVEQQAKVPRFWDPLACHDVWAAVHWYGFQDLPRTQEILDELAREEYHNGLLEQIRQDLANDCTVFEMDSFEKND